VEQPLRKALQSREDLGPVVQALVSVADDGFDAAGKHVGIDPRPGRHGIPLASSWAARI
jgi:hypothetical protein